jgi:hypothetical protein
VLATTAELFNTTEYKGTMATKTQKPSTPKTTNKYFIARLHNTPQQPLSHPIC